MRLRSTTTVPTTNPSATEQADPLLSVRILVEAAMEQAQFADADAELIARQLAGELCKQEAALSDVRVAVQELYQEDRAGAEAYLSYLAKHGFPKVGDTARQTAPVRTVEEQNQAIAQYQSESYGQVTETVEEGNLKLPFYGGNLIAELVANSAYSAMVFGERRSGTSAILRAIAYDQIAKSGSTVLDILDLHNGQWGGLEDIRLADGSQIVTYLTLSAKADVEAVANKLWAIAAEVKRRQKQQRAQSRRSLPTSHRPISSWSMASARFTACCRDGQQTDAAKTPPLAKPRAACG